MKTNLNKIKPLLTGKLKVLVEHLLTNKDGINMVNQSLLVVSKHTEIGLKKIQAKMKQLESIEFVIPYKNGKYLINPYFVFDSTITDHKISKDIYKKMTKKNKIKEIYLEKTNATENVLFKNLLGKFIENGIANISSKFFNKVEYSCQSVIILVSCKSSTPINSVINNINGILMKSANTEILPVIYKCVNNIIPLVITDRISNSNICKILEEAGLSEYQLEHILIALPFAEEEAKMHLFEMIK